MALFYNTRYEISDNKRYLVLRMKPKIILIHLIIIFIIAVAFASIRFLKPLLGEYFLPAVLLMGGLLFLVALSSLVYRWRTIIPRIKGKTVIEKGGTVFNSENPREIWIEQ